MAGLKDILAAMSVRLSLDSAEFDKNSKKAGGLTKSLGAQFKKLQGILLAGLSVAGLVSFVKKSAELYDIQKKAEAGLLNALQGRVGVQKELIAQAQEIQSRTTFGDEAIIEQQKYLASLKMTKDQIKNTIEASVQLSAALGIELSMAVRNLAKTYSGLSGELGELIPQFRNFTAEQLKSGAAIKYINDNFQGFAETAAKTGLGPLDQLKNALGDFQEEIFEYMVPTEVGTTGLPKFLEKYRKSIQDANLLKQAARTSGESLSDWDLTMAKWGKFTKEAEQIFEKAKAVELGKSMEATVKSFAMEKAAAEAKKQLELAEKAKKYAEEVAKRAKEIADRKEKDRIDRLTSENKALKPYQPTETAPEVMLSGQAGGFMSNMQDQATATWEANAERLWTINAMLQDSFADLASSFGEALGDMMTTGDGFNPAGMLNSVAGMMESFGKLAIAAGIAGLGIKQALELHPIPAIVAGVALIALAKAVKNSASNISSGGGGGNYMPANDSSSYATSSTRMYGEGYQAIKIEVNGRIEGDHIRLAYDRAVKMNNRI
jgi:uncharacterized protein (DUF1778 family)